MLVPLRELIVSFLLGSAVLHAAPHEVWDAAALKSSPEVFPGGAIHATDERIRSLLFSNVPFHGKPTRVFAWLGKPQLPEGQRAPGIVLLHGGGGTAFESWVKLWVDRGYAAIAIDHFGGLPAGRDGDPSPRNPQGGPSGGSAVFSQLDEPIGDQWPFHAVAAASRALSLLRAEPGVDPDRIGVTGISWGGYLTCLFAGVDDRLRFAIPVYGCGYHDDTIFGGILRKLPSDQSALWLRQWDASIYLRSVRIPMLWVNGTNDHFFWLPAWRRSAAAVNPELCTRTLKVAMRHGHPPAGDPPEVRAFADSVVRSAPPLSKVGRCERRGSVVTVAFQSARPMRCAVVHFTRDSTGPWEAKVWQSLEATVNGDKATAALPDGVAAYFMNFADDQGFIVSSNPEFVLSDKSYNTSP
jgi:dienelactone hydrolase